MGNMEISYTINTIFLNTIQVGELLEGGHVRPQVTCNTAFFSVSLAG